MIDRNSGPTQADPQRASVLILAHGAGAGQKHPFMVRVARDLGARGMRVVTFDFPYMAAGRKVPDKPDVLERSWREQIEAVRATPELSDLPLFIGGKSMGGRIASQVAAQGVPGLSGLVFLGYPLHPPGRPAQRRDAHLPAIREPMLFVQGERDEFGTASEIQALAASLQRPTLHAVSGANHSLRVPARGNLSQDDVFRAVADRVVEWAGAIISER